MRQIDGATQIQDGSIPDSKLETPGGGGTTDHGALTGLGDDDHTQYHTDARGDSRYMAKTLADAKGDLLAATAADSVARLPVGADGTVLTADSAEATGVKWAARFDPASAQEATVSASETSTSSSFTDLATVGPSVTATIGASGRALVIVSAAGKNNTSATQWVSMGSAVSGATTVAADFNRALQMMSGSTAVAEEASYASVYTGLTPGSNTFTAKYATAAATTGVWGGRRIVVIPL